MCNSCRRLGRWLPNCSDRRGPGTPSPPTPPAHLVQLANYPNVSNASNARSARSNQSVRSSNTGRSVASTSSVDSTATINSVHSLQSLARRISAELYPQERLVTSLRTWLATVDPAAYRREMPWSPQVLAAYNEYKRRAAVHGSAHKAFEDYLNQTRRNTTPEQHLERARLAVAWGESAVSVAEGRLSFIETYRHAYSSTKSISSHIDTGKNAITSGRNAVHEARRNYDSLWVAYSRAANPQVFA
ncbi:hypothetical protein BDV34DRAFT_195853 [Aspergillus parasiticus]|uniref:Uncharacterized protein n=1 Tax=Aspergillus parasiticus TaxID=5067 RepID=A0A5N6DK35_ASPPA|nr:hypothetical protein BDV34DRAFT_195853 [Aspergillus parasiticus]